MGIFRLLHLNMNLFGNTCLDRIITMLNMRILLCKMEIYDVVLEGITHETKATLESMCYGSICYLSVGDVWDLFESLGWHQWHYELC